MSKFLKIPNGDYKVAVQPGGTITLDTGIETGQVIITGDLLVEGTTTEINSTTLVIEDNMIELNRGETGAGISLGESGIKIERGNFLDVFMLFDETINWNSPDGNNYNGAFVLKDSSGKLMALKTNAIETNGGNLNLINQGTGVISVIGTQDYESHVTDPDHIPNKAYVDNAVTNVGDTVTVSGLADFDTSIELRDFQRTGAASVIRFNIDGVERASLTETALTLQNININGNNIIVQGAGSNLVLTHPDTSSSVLIDRTLGIRPVISNLFLPTVPVDGVRIYSDSESIGGTGIYFVNEEGTRDEMVSRSRAILYGIIF